MKTYQLYIKTDGRWEWLCTFDAGTHVEAFHRALHCLGEAHQDTPVRLEQDTETGYRKPCPGEGEGRSS